MSYTTTATSLVDRDYRLLRGLFESRLMTLRHVALLYFAGSLQAAQKRVWKLKNAGFVGERPRRHADEPSVLYLSQLGFQQLSRSRRLADYPTLTWSAMQRRTRVSPLTLQHELDVMTVKASIVRAAADTPGLEVERFSTWPRLFAFPVRTGPGTATWMRPDGYFRVGQADAAGFATAEHHFFLELDRSSESHTRLAAKAAGYAAHYRNGGFARWCGDTAEAYARHPFRVLLVCRTAERRNNAAVTLLHRRPPILSLVWLATLDELCRDPLGLIWIRPVDYRDAAQGTAFDPTATRFHAYRRQVDREDWVESTVPRCRLLDRSAAGRDTPLPPGGSLGRS